MPSSLPARSIERRSGSSLFEAAFLGEVALIDRPACQPANGGGPHTRHRERSGSGHMESRGRVFESPKPLPQAMSGDQPLGVPPRQAAAHEFLDLTRELPMPRP